MTWFCQLFVKETEGVVPYDARDMKDLHEMIIKFGALAAFDQQGIPIREEDGTFEIRAFQKSTLSLIKGILLNNDTGLEIVREIVND